MDKSPAWQQNTIQPVSTDIKVSLQAISDSIGIYTRNPVSDFTFYDSNNLIRRIDGVSQGFPELYLEKNKQIAAGEKAMLIKKLRPGDELPAASPDTDLVLGVLLTSVLLFTIVSITSRNLLPAVSRFFTFRSSGNTARKEGWGLLLWQSVILNLASFMLIAIFLYSAASHYGYVPTGMKPTVFWIIVLGVIVTAVLLRILICTITGNLSSHREEFIEYVSVIYSSYRISAVLLALVVILLNYTTFLPSESYIIPGIVVFALMYIIRIIRLMSIFINKGISIFYLILYLCALEFLPVVVSVKYFTGLV